MIGICSKCKEMCEVVSAHSAWRPGEWYTPKYESNRCGAPLIEDGERSHEEE